MLSKEIAFQEGFETDHSLRKNEDGTYELVRINRAKANSEWEYDINDVVETEEFASKEECLERLDSLDKTYGEDVEDLIEALKGGEG